MPYRVGSFIHGVHENNINHPARLQGRIVNPANALVLGEVGFADTADIERAVQSAATAYPEWSATPPAKRAKILFCFHSLLKSNIDTLADIIVNEQGKTLSDAKGSIQRGIEVVEHACGIPQLLQGTFSQQVSKDIDTYSIRQSLGVCLGISPFNFPVMVPLWLVIPAIACGNTFILKPSEQNPSAPVLLAQLLKQAGLPDGVFNIVHGQKQVVETLIQHPKIQAVAAVASTAVAESIYHLAHQHGKRVQTFGGAKNHCIVMPDADLKEASRALTTAAYGAAGERCMAISVAVVVGEETADQLVRHLKQDMAEITVGDGHQPDVEMGPLISQNHLQRVLDYIEIGVAEGARLVVDGRTKQVINSPGGFFMGPCLFDHVETHMRVYQEEIFGPVLGIVRVKDFETALQRVNQHPYGNGAAILTRDLNIARAFADQVQAGMVGINIPIPVPFVTHGFGGWKRSFFGDLGMHGHNSVEFFTKLKSVTTAPAKGGMASFAMLTH
jgi:malonate-semialdehyde dehydrogenase (acetylating)/methylmalonate-semialdehyde dehydrogenase